MRVSPGGWMPASHQNGRSRGRSSTCPRCCETVLSPVPCWLPPQPMRRSPTPNTWLPAFMPVPVGEAEFQRVIAPLRFGWIQMKSSAASMRKAWCCSIDCSLASPRIPRCCMRAVRCIACAATRTTCPARWMISRVPLVRRSPRRKPFARSGWYKGSSAMRNAAEAFDRYLALDPHAPDAELLRSYLSDLKS